MTEIDSGGSLGLAAAPGTEGDCGATGETPGGSARVSPASSDQPTLPPPSDTRSEVGSSVCAEVGSLAGKEDGGKEKEGPSAASLPGGSGGNKRKRKRVRKRPRSARRRYKPYHKLSYEELKELETREATRAEKRRATQFSNGRAMAPYNTTQFIMEDLEARNGEPDLSGLVEKWKERGGSRERTYSGTGSFEDSGEDQQGSFSSDASASFDLDAEFDAQYASASLERLQAMDKPDLIQNVVSLEAEVCRADVETRELRQMVNRLRQDNYALRKTLRENGLQEVRPASAPPRQPLPALLSPPAQPPPPQPQHDQAPQTAPMDPVI